MPDLTRRYGMSSNDRMLIREVTDSVSSDSYPLAASASAAASHSGMYETIEVGVMHLCVN